MLTMHEIVVRARGHRDRFVVLVGAATAAATVSIPILRILSVPQYSVGIARILDLAQRCPICAP